MAAESEAMLSSWLEIYFLSHRQGVPQRGEAGVLRLGIRRQGPNTATIQKRTCIPFTKRHLQRPGQQQVST